VHLQQIEPSSFTKFLPGSIHKTRKALAITKFSASARPIKSTRGMRLRLILKAGKIVRAISRKFAGAQKFSLAEETRPQLRVALLA